MLKPGCRLKPNFLLSPILEVCVTMNITQILQGVDNLSAGPTYSVGFLAHHLAGRSHSVRVLSLGEEPTSWPYAAPLYIYGGRICRYGLAPYSAVRAVITLMTQPGILHGHGVWRISNLFPLLPGKHPMAKLVWSPRGMFSPWSWKHKAIVKRPFWHTLQKPALDRVDCFHATAPIELDDVRRVGFRQPVAVIPNGVELPYLPKFPKKGKQVVFLSRIHEKKGLHLLIPAWGELAKQFPDWELAIAGKLDSLYAEHVQQLVRENNIPRVTFLGEVLGEDKTNLLANARLFVLPTFSENFGIAIAEALAHAIPVITTVETPWTDLPERGCGWCIRPEQKALRDVLADAMARPLTELDAMGHAGRKWIAEDYGWENVAVMMELLYRWLLGEGSRPEFVFV